LYNVFKEDLKMPEKIPKPHEPTASTNATNIGGTEPTATTNATNAGGTEPAVRLVTVEGQAAHKDAARTKIKDQFTDLKIEVIKLDAKIDVVKETLNTKIVEKIDGLEKSLKAEIGAVKESLNSFKYFAIGLLVAILAAIVVTSI
jgi:hypothetical protein